MENAKAWCINSGGSHIVDLAFESHTLIDCPVGHYKWPVEHYSKYYRLKNHTTPATIGLKKKFVHALFCFENVVS